MDNSSVPFLASLKTVRTHFIDYIKSIVIALCPQGILLSELASKFENKKSIVTIQTSCNSDARKKRFKYPKRYYLGKQKRKEDFIRFEPVVSKEGANSSLHLPVSIPLKYDHDIVTSKEIDASLLVTIPLQLIVMHQYVPLRAS